MNTEAQQQEIEERIKKQLHEKRMRVLHLANMIIMRPESRDPYVLDGIAIELRSLAFHIRALEKGTDALILAQ